MACPVYAQSKYIRRHILPKHTTIEVWASPLSLAATKGIIVYITYEPLKQVISDIQVLLFSFPLVTEMFHFTRSSSHTYVFSM